MSNKPYPKNAKIERRVGGWFVVDDVRGWSGPWHTEEAAKLAKSGKFDEARRAERGTAKSARRKAAK